MKCAYVKELISELEKMKSNDLIILEYDSDKLFKRDVYIDRETGGFGKPTEPRR